MTFPRFPSRHHATPAAARVSPWSALRVWLLLVALLIAPWLGTVHSVLHASTSKTAVVSFDSHLPAAVGASSSDADACAGTLRRLFGDHSHSGDCRLYDQLSHADGLQHALTLPPVLLPPVAVLAWHAGECLRRWATLFDARGPPSLA
ncbi:hypothetical protein [Xylophilus sp. GOD-11R]|uniref:hypothetical protein n=1 Tax=Xylophilus sp. GOD-11R TaxID=3089814 RepID=UPI00298CFD84|nr:hypothetical protein [Xylophilus sp. GOD-11R]WPB58489.1 hypothetical protein R9X41_07565 [Xylophilus sp. GOD-11R]